MSVLVMILSVVGTAFIYWTFKETRRTAKAAEDAVAESRNVAAMQFQPKMLVRGFNITLKDDEGNVVHHHSKATRYDAECMIENVGDVDADIGRSDLVVFTCRGALPNVRPYDVAEPINPVGVERCAVGTNLPWARIVD